MVMFRLLFRTQTIICCYSLNTFYRTFFSEIIQIQCMAVPVAPRGSTMAEP